MVVMLHHRDMPQQDIHHKVMHLLDIPRQGIPRNQVILLQLPHQVMQLLHLIIIFHQRLLPLQIMEGHLRVPALENLIQCTMSLFQNLKIQHPASILNRRVEEASKS
jgi:hypothetical protein